MDSCTLCMPAFNSFIGQIMWEIAQNHWIPWIHHENMSTTPISDIRHVYQMITPSDLMGWFHGIERATSKMSKCFVVKVLDDKYQSFDRMDFSMDFSIPDVQISKLYNYLIQIFELLTNHFFSHLNAIYSLLPFRNIDTHQCDRFHVKYNNNKLKFLVKYWSVYAI